MWFLGVTGIFGGSQVAFRQVLDLGPPILLGTAVPLARAALRRKGRRTVLKPYRQATMTDRAIQARRRSATVLDAFVVTGPVRRSRKYVSSMHLRLIEEHPLSPSGHLGSFCVGIASRAVDRIMDGGARAPRADLDERMARSSVKRSVLATTIPI